MQPELSIVTAVYNGEKYFQRALPSIQSQTFTEFEYILVDDGSTDRTLELLKERAAMDSRLKVYSPGRIGFVNALNFGISRAKGTFIARQDFDDISYPDRLQLEVEALRADKTLGLVGGWYVLVDDARRERYIRKAPTVHEDIVRQMGKCIPFAHTLTMFRRTAWEQANGYPPLDDIEDLHLWTTMCRCGWRAANIPQVIGEHWVYGDSFWHQTFRYRGRQLKLARAQWRAIRELDLPLWMAVFPAGRIVYAHSPNAVKKLLRRRAAGSVEQDLDPQRSASQRQLGG